MAVVERQSIEAIPESIEKLALVSDNIRVAQPAVKHCFGSDY